MCSIEHAMDGRAPYVKAPTGRRRAHKEAEGECEASECNLLCEDMLRAGFSRFVVDPGVRQAYFPDTARQLYTKKARRTACLCRDARWLKGPRAALAFHIIESTAYAPMASHHEGADDLSRDACGGTRGPGVPPTRSTFTTHIQCEARQVLSDWLFRFLALRARSKTKTRAGHIGAVIYHVKYVLRVV